VAVLEMVQEPIKKLPFETSAENMALWLFQRIKRETQLPIVKIELAETKSSNVIYSENSEK
jgi:6-pyruvoyl-tetrahydropterin synthase